MQCKLALIVLNICCAINWVYPQRLQIELVQLPNVGDKVLEGRINRIYQDKTGFIWIGKETGLYRYDGKEIKAFRNNLADSTSISGNNIRYIFEDSNEDLWIGVRGAGLNRYNRRTGAFTNYLHDDKDSTSINCDEVSAIMPDGKGNFWIGTDGGGLNYFNTATRKFKSFAPSPNSPMKMRSNKILSVVAAGKDKYWIGTWGGGLHLFNAATKKIWPVGEGTRFERLNILCVKEIKPGTLWLATFEGELLAYNIRLDKFYTIMPGSKFNTVRDIEISARGEIFVAANSGLLYFQTDTSKFQIIDCKEVKFLTISDIFMDRTQILWVGSKNSGLLGKINSFHKKFRTFSASSSLGQFPTLSIYADKSDGYVYFSSNNRFIKFNPQTDHYQSLYIPYKHAISVLGLPKIKRVICKGDSDMLVFEKNTNRLLPLKFEFEQFGKLFNTLNNSLYTADSSTFWLATMQGAYQIVLDTLLNVSNIKRAFYVGVKDGLSKCNHVSCFLQHPNGDLFIGTAGGGLNWLKAGASSFIHLKHNPTNKQSIPNNYVECLALDQKGNVLVGTQEGLCRFNIHTLAFSNLRVPDGLAEDRIISLAVDAKNRIWASTLYHISLVSEDFKTIQNNDFRKSDFYCSFCLRAVTTDRAGNIFFGSDKGLVWFHPDSIQNNPHLPQAVVVDFKINGEKVLVSNKSPLKEAIEITREICLTSKQTSFSFQMAALSYFNPDKNMIMYKLEGYDKEWRKAGLGQTADYKNVKPGTYIFKIRAANEDGLWNPEEKHLKITITRPVWLRWYFIGLYFLCLAAVILYFYRLQKQVVINRSAASGAPAANFNRIFNVEQSVQIVKDIEEQKFLKKAILVIDENLSDPDFGVYQLAEKLNMSRSQLYRKINHLFNGSVADFIKDVRLKRAAQLLLENPGVINSVSFKVGFNDPKYFRKCFKQQFGVTLVEFIANNKESDTPKGL